MVQLNYFESVVVKIQQEKLAELRNAETDICWILLELYPKIQNKQLNVISSIAEDEDNDLLNTHKFINVKLTTLKMKINTLTIGLFLNH